MGFIFLFTLSMVSWAIFSGYFDAFHLSLGVLFSTLVSVMCVKIIFPKEGPSQLKQIMWVIRGIPYFFWLLKEVLVANFHVLSIALLPGGFKQLNPSLVNFKLRLKSKSARYLLANSITLTPGTVSVKVDGDQLLVHSISRKTTEALQGDMEERVAWIFGESLEEVSK